MTKGHALADSRGSHEDVVHSVRDAQAEPPQDRLAAQGLVEFRELDHLDVLLAQEVEEPGEDETDDDDQDH